MLQPSFQRKLSHQGRPMSQPCSTLKSNLEPWQRTSASKSKQNRAYTQSTRQRDVLAAHYQPTKSIPCHKHHSGQSSLYRRSSSGSIGTQLCGNNKSTAFQKNANKQNEHDLGAGFYTRPNSALSLRGRRFSAPLTRSFYRASELHQMKCAPKSGSTYGSKVSGARQRCMSAPKTFNGLRNSSSLCNTLTEANLTNEAVKTRKTGHPTLTEKFSSSLLSKPNELDNESMSDVMSFADDVIERQLDTYSTSDNASIVDVRCRPQSCISFRRTVDHTLVCKHYVSYVQDRPRSSPSPVRLLW